METIDEYLMKIDNPDHRSRVREVLDWTEKAFPELEAKIAWNQPVFTHHGTFIIGYSTSKKHLAAAPEQAGIDQFAGEITEAGYYYTKQLIRMPWEMPVDFSLLKEIIRFNMEDKKDCNTFWRK
ncbi:iron chaperone [Alkalicoccus saliphilus]|uniref:Iron chaperone n=1 Tax=Alkalicoccus saliphilus TaxID=200989 RepID=A0A2T4U1Y8_9BACI|nr:iron chaperone [Alkalicoccus saliphilus]PTL37375.1 iron chaperone [Alkalicoccus saliphilus]